MKNTIVSIAPYTFLPANDGGRLGILNIEQLLSIHNRLFTLSTKENEPNGNLPFTLVPFFTNDKARYLQIGLAKQISLFAAERKANYIFCHHHYMFPAAYKAAKKLDIPIYIRSHNIESERFKSTGKSWWRLMERFEKWAYNKADKTFFVTEEDKTFAIQHFGVPKDKTYVLPFGVNFDAVPYASPDLKLKVAEEFKLNKDASWLFFMGKLDYPPNADAVQTIVQEILPRLKKERLNFEIIICGKNLNETLKDAISVAGGSIHYLGFVPDLSYILGTCTVMLNPVITGGGVKTKVIESLSWDKTVVSTQSGAQGIEPKYCGEKLLLSNDNDYEGFVEQIKLALAQKDVHIPNAFFEYYNNAKIAERIQEFFQ